MESSSHLSLETNQSSVQGYSTPPRSNIRYESSSSSSSPNLSFSQLFHQSKILTSAELKRRFSPIKSSIKKHRHNFIQKTDSIVPLKQNLHMPMILEKLFDYKEDLSIKSLNENDCIVPISSSKFSFISSKIIHHQPSFDCFISDSFKTEQKHLFSISETTMKQKFQTLLQNK
ncbi:unnamed protein product [Rotaria sordida]|uniref:Uncharacterized protein n=1 Tax=Rotaria sordida TaxID=392033 RepID=A0A818TAV6_9BILA|nr:unnamed protein product [Rotaria sordida]CAF3682217.1 unnamed protein product [Rotaria sordida]